MEIDKTTPTAGAIIEKEGGSALDIALHPLVLINISDHYTRAKYSTEEKNPRVIGALFGVQSGRNVEVTNSFELVYNIIEGAVVIDTDYLKAKQEQCTLFAFAPLPSARTDFFKNKTIFACTVVTVFKNHDLLGWYSTGAECKPADIQIHNQVPITIILFSWSASVCQWCCHNSN
jgi:COP9 signalosome complex subunit 6